MNYINQIVFVFELLIQFIFSIKFLLIVGICVIIFHVLMYFIRDKKYIKPFQDIDDHTSISINDLKELPIVNIIVPAWKEGESFRRCMMAITDLTYPHIKVIVSAGGNNETIVIANSFKKNDNFTILYQKEGEGKIKAINDCLKHISKGLIYLIDADVLLNDQVFLYVLSEIINQKHDIIVCSLRPHDSVISKDIVKYLYINRNPSFKLIFSKFEANLLGPNACLNYEVFENVEKFSEGKLGDDNIIVGNTIKGKGFNVYFLYWKSYETFTFPTTIKESIHQNVRYIENYLFNLYKSKNKKLLTFPFILLISIYMFIFPFIAIFNFYLFMIGIIILLHNYLKRIRKIIFYKSTTNKEASIKLGLSFYFKIIPYMYLDALNNIIAIFELLFYRKSYKKRKNIA